MYEKLQIVFPDHQLVLARIDQLQALPDILEADAGGFVFWIIGFASVDAVGYIQMNRSGHAA